MGGHLHIHRPKQYADGLRRYKILVDGVIEEEISAGSSVWLEVSPGRHELMARIDWASSNTLTVEVEEGIQHGLEVGSNVQGWRVSLALLYNTVWSSEALYLREYSPNSPGA